MSRLLPDEPASVDAFGSHGGIADAVVELIQAGNKGLAVGLIGDRGSGKSTVVRLVTGKLLGDSSTAAVPVVCFDAWAHSGAPLHKAFLEQFRSVLGKRVQPELSAKVEETLNRREEITQSSDQMRFTSEGKTLVWTGLLVPAGAAVVAAGPAGHPRLFWFGLTAALAPALWVLFKLIRAAMRESGSIMVRFGAAWKKVAKVFVTEPERSRLASTTYTPEPGSVEFARLFKSLAEALGGSPAVIVFDNIDRLDDHERISAWSVMRAYSDALGEMDVHRVWTLVPVGGTPEKEEPDPNKKGDRNGAEQDTLSKALQATFLVPQPLPSDWKAYARNLFQDAELGWDPNEVELAISCLGAAARSRKRLPTPRAMKLFVNQIVTLELGQTGLVNRNACAALAAAWHAEPAWGPRDPVPSDLRAISGFPVKEVAALYYRTESKKALQILYSSEIATALAEGDRVKLASLFEECQDLGATLQDVAETDLGGLHDDMGPVLARWATAVLGVPLPVGERGAVLNLIRARLLGGKTGWNALNVRCVPGIAHFCSADDTSAQKLLSSIAESFSETAPDDRVNWADAFDALLTDFPGWDRISPRLAVGRDANDYLELLRLLMAERLDFPGPACARAEVVSELAARASSGSADDKWCDLVAACQGVRGDWGWTALLVAVGNALSRDGATDTAPLLRVLLTSYHQSPDAALNALAVSRNSGWLFSRFAALGNTPEMILALLLTGTDPGPQGGAPAPSQGAHSGREKYRAWLTNPANADEVGTLAFAKGAANVLLAKIDGPSAKKAIGAILKHVAATQTEWPPASALYQYRVQLREALGADLFDERVRANAPSIAALASEAPFSLEDVWIYELIAGAVDAALDNRLALGFQDLPAAEWSKIFASGGKALTLAFRLAHAGQLLTGGGMEEALTGLAKHLANQGQTSATATEITALCDALEESSGIPRLVLTTLVDSKASLKPLLRVFGPTLGKLGIGVSDAEKILQDPTQLALQRDDGDELALLGPLVSRCTAPELDVPSDIIARVRKLASESNHCPQNLAAAIAMLPETGDAVAE